MNFFGNNGAEAANLAQSCLVPLFSIEEQTTLPKRLITEIKLKNPTDKNCETIDLLQGSINLGTSP